MSEAELPPQPTAPKSPTDLRERAKRVREQVVHIPYGETAVGLWKFAQELDARARALEAENVPQPLLQDDANAVQLPQRRGTSSPTIDSPASHDADDVVIDTPPPRALS